MDTSLSGNRLRECIKDMGYKMKDFAESSGVSQETLSRYINGKVAIPQAYISKASFILGVGSDYLSGATDEKIKTRSIVGSSMVAFNGRQRQFLAYEGLLDVLGVQLERSLSIGGVTYQERGLGWVRVTDTDDIGKYPDELNAVEYIKAIYDRPGECSITVRAEYHGRIRHMSLDEYNMWIKGWIAAQEVFLQTFFGVETWATKAADGFEERALHGEPPVEW